MDEGHSTQRAEMAFLRLPFITRIAPCLALKGCDFNDIFPLSLDEGVLDGGRLMRPENISNGDERDARRPAFHDRGQARCYSSLHLGIELNK